MLHSLLEAYLDKIYAALHNLSGAHFECYQEKALSSKRLNLKIRIRFAARFSGKLAVEPIAGCKTGLVLCMKS